MKVLFEPIWPWPWVALVVVATLAVVMATYRRRLARLPPAQRVLLLGLRLVAWAVLMFSLARPLVEFTRVDPHGAALLILADASRSMGVKDGPLGASRRETLLKAVADAQPEIDALRKTVEVVLADFAEEPAVVESLRPEAPGSQTALGNCLDRAAQLVEGKRVAGIVLLSDFAQRAVAPYDIDPRAAASRLAEQHIRIDTVGFGASGLTESAIDLAVEDLTVSPTVFVKNTVVVSAKIRALGAANRELTARLLVEDPASALGTGEPAPLRVADAPIRLRPTQNQEVLAAEFRFTALNPGEFKLQLEVLPLEGEPLTANNSQTTYFTVLKGGIRVAYIDRLRPEMTYLKRIDESPDMRLDFYPVKLSAGRDTPAMPEDLFAPGKYDVYIIGSVPARAFGQDNLKRIARAVEQGAGLLMTGGTQSFGPGGYAETALADVLPIRMNRTEFQSGDEIDLTLHHDKQLQMLPTSQGLRHFIMRLDVPEKNLARWEALPKLDQANRFENRDIKPLAQELATTPERIPLLLAQDYGKGRAMAFAADTTFLWWKKGFEEAHQRFWQQTMLWLAHKDQHGDESVWVKLDARRFRAGQPVNFTFGARDPDKRPIDDAEFKIEVVGPDDKRHSLTPSRLGGDFAARFLDTQVPGEYRLHIEASKGGQPIGLPVEARFVVYEYDLELHNPAADFVMMEELLRITGGTNVAPGELGNYFRKLAHQGLNPEITEIRRVSLWDNWQLLALFAATMTCEWFLRKRRGLV